MNRTQMRENAFKLLYSLEVQKKQNLEEQIDIYLQSNEIEDEEAITYIKDAIMGIEKNQEQIQSAIEI